MRSTLHSPLTGLVSPQDSTTTGTVWFTGIVGPLYVSQ